MGQTETCANVTLTSVETIPLLGNDIGTNLTIKGISGGTGISLTGIDIVITNSLSSRKFNNSYKKVPVSGILSGNNSAIIGSFDSTITSTDRSTIIKKSMLFLTI